MRWLRIYEPGFPKLVLRVLLALNASFGAVWESDIVTHRLLQ